MAGAFCLTQLSRPGRTGLAGPKGRTHVDSCIPMGLAILTSRICSMEMVGFRKSQRSSGTQRLHQCYGFMQCLAVQHISIRFCLLLTMGFARSSIERWKIPSSFTRFERRRTFRAAQCILLVQPKKGPPIYSLQSSKQRHTVHKTIILIYASRSKKAHRSPTHDTK